jgi:WD40 repeat protein
MRVLAGLLALGVAISVGAAEPQNRPFVGATFTSNKIVVVDSNGKIEWEHDAPACMDVWALPNGNFLYSSRSKGIIEITRDKKIVFQFKTDGETYTCQRLPNGRTLIGDNRNGRLIEVDSDGKIQREIKLTTGAKEHGMIRAARWLPGDHYLVAQREDNIVREYDAQSKVVWEHKMGGPMTALRLPNGNTLISGASGDVVEVDKDGKEAWSFKVKDYPTGVKGKAYGLQRLANGNTVIVCQGTVLEVTPEKKAVWTAKATNLMGVQLLDEKGDATKGEIIR